MSKFDLFIVPVAGLDQNGEPDENGKARIETAVKSGATYLAIIGGTIKNGKSLAEIYYDYLVRSYPRGEAPCVAIVEANSVCTNKDIALTVPEIFRLAGRLQRISLKLGVTSYGKHMDRIELVLRKYCYAVEKVESGEKQAFSNFVESFLTSITKLDPTWRTIGWPLFYLAKFRFDRTFNKKMPRPTNN